MTILKTSAISSSLSENSSANHDMCVVNYLHSVNASPSVKNVVPKVQQVWKLKQVKQVWKPTGKILTNVGCSKHMTRDHLRLRNFMKKFIETVRFGNDHFGAIMGYGDYVIGDSVISKHSCYVRDTNGVQLIKGSCGYNLYTISVEDKMKSSLICLLSKASKNKSWLWHRRLNHLNFYTINDLARKDLVRGLPRLKFEKDHLCSACQLVYLVPKTPQQNGIVKRRNRTLVEAAMTMLIFSKALMFLWVEAIATAFFGALCYPTNDSEDLGKLQLTADIGIFVGYAPSRKGYKIYNKRTRRIMETIHVQFDELSELVAPMQLSTGPAPTFLTLEHINGSPSSTTIDQDAPSPSHSPSSLALQSLSFQQGVAAESTSIKDNLLAPLDNDPLVNVFALEPCSEASSTGDVCSTDSTHVTQTHHHLRK
ncbi:integrase, catalytic region, zinc finger, CCHC-type containing protein [Tanacetum coccineum]